MKRIIKKEYFREGMPIANTNDLTLDECIILTKAFFYDFDEDENWKKQTVNYYINHANFETIDDYINFYDENGYIIVIT